MVHGLVAAAQTLAAELLAPAAARVERDGVPREHLKALGAAGLLGLAAPVEAGGAAASRAVARAVAEILAAACPTTWFVQAQHHHPVALLAGADAPVSGRLLPPLARGELVAGIAFAHLRRAPQPSVSARRVDGGWVLHGTAPWYTGWTLNDLALIAALDGDRTVWGFVDAVEQRGLRASPPLQTAAIAGAQTVRLELDGLFVADADVVAVTALADWQAEDRVRTSDANPAVFGVTDAAVRLLEQTGAGQPEAAETAAALALRLDAARTRSYGLADADPAGERLQERRAARAEAYDVLITATTAAVVAAGGRAMLADAPHQRLARTALFLLVQAQTAPIRTATLHHLTRR